MITVTPIDLLHALPLMVIALFTVVVVLADAFSPKEADRSFTGYLALAGIIIAAGIDALMWAHSDTLGHPLFAGMAVHDRYAIFLNMVFYIGAAAVTLSAIGYFKEQRFHHGEFYALLLSSLLGLMLLSMATDLLMMFVALELTSITVYVLAGFMRHRLQSAEAALKYFLMGAFASAFMLFGLALIYGETGDTGYFALSQHVRAFFHNTVISDPQGNFISGHPAMLIGMLFVLIGFAFKASLVPFHMWTPDAYTGAPTPSTSYMSAGVKAGVFAALFRMFVGAMPDLYAVFPGWGDVLWTLAMLTMIIGNLLALTQDNIKRMLAYSSIAHAGYILVAMVAAGASIGTVDSTNGAMLFYLLIYTLASVGAFAVVIRFGRYGDENLLVSKGWGGIGYKDPLAGVAMVIFMLSFAGFPPTAGFVAKFYVFKTAVAAGFVDLAIVGVLTSLISVYYYARVIVFMYMKPQPQEGYTGFTLALPVAIVVAISAICVIALGILPGSALSLADAGMHDFFTQNWLSEFTP